MEPYIAIYFFSFLSALLSATIVSFITYFLNRKNFKWVALFGERATRYAELMPILEEPYNQTMSTPELESIINSAILVSPPGLSNKINHLRNVLIDLRLGKNTRIRWPKEEKESYENKVIPSWPLSSTSSKSEEINWALKKLTSEIRSDIQRVMNAR